MDTKTPATSSLNVKIRKLVPEAVIPQYAKPGDAGLDLTCTDLEFPNLTKAVYSTGLAIEIPEGYVGLLYPRSSIHKSALTMANSVGVIDSGYRGEIKIVFKLTTPIGDANLYSIGDRIAQLLIVPYPTVRFEEVDSLSTTSRGDTGFGSSGN